MTSLVVGGVALVVILAVLAGWRRSARVNGELGARLDAKTRLVGELVAEVDRLASAPPDRDEQQRMLDSITASGRRALPPPVT